MNSLTSKLIRRATFAGSWYESNADNLDNQLTMWLDSADSAVPPGHRLKAIIGPHAGLRFSGPTAAWAYRNISKEQAQTIERVVLLGPSHRVFLDFCATTVCSEWETPLGNFKIDQDKISELTENDESKLFSRIKTQHEESEHSLELHLPFIYKAFKDVNRGDEVRLLPLMVGQLPDEQRNEFARALLPLFKDEKTLFVVSSDFAHWGSRFQYQYIQPDDKELPIHEGIEKLDKRGMSIIETQKEADFLAYLKETKNTICGRNPILLLLSIIEEAAKEKPYETKFVHYDQSSPCKNKDDSSVSYAAGITYFKQN